MFGNSWHGSCNSKRSTGLKHHSLLAITLFNTMEVIMKTRFFTSFLAAAVLLLFALSFAQTTTTPVEHGSNFVDENGDGYNDNAPDADGDGIPNGQDPDYVKPADGTGAGNSNAQGTNDSTARGNGQGKGARFHGFVDEDGDGINDNLRDADGDGVPNCQDSDWVRPMDGSGAKAGKGARGGKGFGKGNSGQPSGGSGTQGGKGSGNKGGKGN
jgi:hypothetical protein